MDNSFTKVYTTPFDNYYDKWNLVSDSLINLNDKASVTLKFRENTVKQLMSVLISESKPNALLIGNAGCGKTRIVEYLANQIANDSKYIPAQLEGYTIYSLDLASLISNCSLVGQLENKVNTLISFFKDKNNKAILFLDEVHILFTSEPYEKVAQLLKPYLARGEIKMIAATTTQEAKLIDNDPAFNRRFTKVLVDELTKEQTTEILLSMIPAFSRHYKCRIGFCKETASRLVEIADTFCSSGSHRPDNAITLLDRAIAKTIVDDNLSVIIDPNESLRNENYIGLTSDIIRKVAIQITSGNSEPLSFNEHTIRESLSNIKGQDDIIDDILQQLKLYDMHIYPTKKPLTFLFVGSSGVGKTELAKAISHSYFHEPPITLNMTEYHDASSINRIIGAPAGYIGYKDTNELPFDILDTNPYQIILLDEFEKCHQSVQRLFMSVFDEGVLRTNHGKLIDFSKCIIIATTNAGFTNIKKDLGFLPYKDTDSKITLEKLSHHFDVALLNRFNHWYTFHDISIDVYKEILINTYASMVQHINTSCEKSIKYRLKKALGEKELISLIQKTYDANLGARPAHKCILEYINEAISS